MSQSGDYYDPEIEVVRGRLDRWIDYSTFGIQWLGFGSLFVLKFDPGASLGFDDLAPHQWGEIWPIVTAPDFTGKLSAFLLANAFPMALFVFTALWYGWYAATVRKELGIIATLFGRLRPPREYAALQGGGSVPALAIGLTVCFIGLAWFCDNLAVYCVVVLVLNALDLQGNITIRRNLRAFFNDDTLRPLDADAAPFIARRRRIAEVYWLERWQLQRIVIMMIANVVALVVWLAPEIFRMSLPAPLEAVRAPLAHGIVIGLILWNQWLLTGWRAVRDTDLRQVNLDELRAEAERYAR